MHDSNIKPSRYCVRFLRRDNAVPPVEEYYYWNKEDAELHMQEFRKDDADFKEMYSAIQLITYYGKKQDLSVISEEIRF